MFVSHLGFSQLATKGQSPQERERLSRNDKRIYRNRIVPNWIGSQPKFWYRNDLALGAREFVFVDATLGKRQLAFDHQAVADAIGNGVKATHLPIDALEFDENGNLVALRNDRERWNWNGDSQTWIRSDEVVKQSALGTTSDRNPRNRARTGADSSVSFENRLAVPVEIFWLSGDGTKQSYGKIEPGKVREQHTFGGHRWLILNDKQESLGEIVADDTPTQIIIDGRKFGASPVPSPRASRSRENEPSTLRSPDGKWIAQIEGFNVRVKNSETGDSIDMSQDGREGQSYSQLTWAPDSKTLVAFRTTSVERKEVHLVRSSPPEGGRAVLESRPYSLPGDPFPKYELNLFKVDSREQIKPSVDPFEHEWNRPRVRFSPSGDRLTYEQVDRGHTRFRLIEVRLSDGLVRNLIDEASSTFVWTAHTENQNLPKITWLKNSDEMIFATERNGWRQLVLIDAITGQDKSALTPEGIVVRGIDWVDEENRRVWFSASGREGQDPYLMHFGWVEFDTGKLVWLTSGDGNHALQYSPDRKYVIDTYSRVDLGPRSELRNTADGSLNCLLEQADLSELEATGWKAPEVFVSKGRDGKTDIWGIICRPDDFDPSKKYPVIEDIYAGPHGSFVPKSFSPSTRFESLTRLGFIVVKVDGMGTANRSKAFQDVCWKNLKDAGFEDRILWIKAAAAKHPEMDLDRVGIYGTSAGGQNAAAAVLFHPEFYKAAVAACGCHDNRLDKASWNEQWMGYPVGPHYSECSNIDNAHRLGGKLLLIVGEMDTNVPPESTMRFADALIRAQKDFDMLVVPNAGHGMGGTYGQRKMHDFFVRHLKP
jgi:dipeptidyl-peptidase 4